jgi:tight adherence protein B
MLNFNELFLFASIAGSIFATAICIRRIKNGSSASASKLDWLPDLEIQSSTNPDHASPESHDKVDLWLHRVVSQSGTGLRLEPFLLLNLLVAFAGGWLVIEFMGSILLAIAATVVLFAIGVTAIWIAFSIRRKKFQEQFPTAIDLVAGSVEAGHSFGDALRLASEASEEPVESELLRCVKQIELGMSPARSIQQMANRIPTMDVKLFSHTISVHEEMGGQLGNTLRRMAAFIRQRSDDVQKIKSATSLGRFAVLMICSTGLLAFGYLMLFHPDYIGKLLNSELGRQMAIYAVVSEIVGLAFVLLTIQNEA